MFGLTFEKLFLVAIIAGVLIGPQRLPAYAHQLRETVRGLRTFLDTSRARAEAEMGVVLTRAEWEALDLRQYDPRRIVRDALDTPPPSHPTGAAAGTDAAAEADAADAAAGAERAALLAEAARVRPGQRFLATGSAAHPRRIAIASLPASDPRWIAANQATEAFHSQDQRTGAAYPSPGDDQSFTTTCGTGSQLYDVCAQASSARFTGASELSPSSSVGRPRTAVGPVDEPGRTARL